MSKPLILLLGVLAVGGCLSMQSERDTDETVTTYSDAWTTVTVSGGTPISGAEAVSGSPDANGKILTGTFEGGNREYLFTDSIRRENGVITALVEYRYAAAQILPESGRSYTHNHWLEQIDCTHHIRSIRATTQYNAEGQIVDANEYAVPRYSAEDIKMLSKPDDGVIREVCQRINTPAAPDHAIASEAASASMATASAPAASAPADPPEDTAASAPAAASQADPPQEAASAPASASAASDTAE